MGIFTASQCSLPQYVLVQRTSTSRFYGAAEPGSLLLRSSLWAAPSTPRTLNALTRAKPSSVRTRSRDVTARAVAALLGEAALLSDIVSSLPVQDVVHSLTLAVGVGLPCTVMECGDVIYRSTLPQNDSLRVTAGGIAFLSILAAYLWSTPGVAPGFWDMFVLAPMETRFRRKLSKDDLSLGKKIGEGSFGTVYKATLAKPYEKKDAVQLVVKRANEFGAAEIWMNERVRRGCRECCADYVHGFLESKGRAGGEEFWLVWKYEGDATLADIMLSKDFPYNVEEALLGPDAGSDLPKGVEREERIIRNLMRQILVALQRLHSIGIIHRDIKPQNLIFSQETGLVKIIDLGAAADLRVGINYVPKEFLLDPRYAAPEQYIMSTQTPSAPPPPVAAALSPVLWQMNLPDRFDIYSAGLIFLQMAFPSMRSDSGLINFNRQLKRCDYDLEAWRESVNARKDRRNLSELQRGFALLDYDNGHSWELLKAMIKFNGRQRISAAAALAHPYFHPGEQSVLQRLRLASLRLLYRDNSDVSTALSQFLARSATESAGGFTEAQLQGIRDKERQEKKKRKASLPRNVLASVLRLQRKVTRTMATTMDSTTDNSKKWDKWWNRWES
eukprot:TRINITY_DN2001_c0_g1_i3.p1 TRINITY_DN2001_c0_g1~~TRINITY_DN2001_c0_g1_i3.p1  ORF type:complete len:615 (+),score=150.37 TRINITY_DN2001_c0_g1_i3:235-2079(+)